MLCKQLTRVLTIALALVALMVPIMAPASAYAQVTTFEFTANDGLWSVDTNWDPPTGPPAVGDRAVVLTGNTCRIQTQDEDALEVVVESGATLSLEEGYSLTLHGYVGQADEALTVEGDLILNESSGGAPSAIQFETGQEGRDDFVINGGGTISAIADDDGEGLFAAVDGVNEHIRIIFDSDLLVTGTIAFEDVDVRNNGDFYVSAGVSVDDVMTFDGATPAGAAVVSGAGTFEVDGAGAAMVMTDVLVGTGMPTIREVMS